MESVDIKITVFVFVFVVVVVVVVRIMITLMFKRVTADPRNSGREGTAFPGLGEGGLNVKT